MLLVNVSDKFYIRLTKDYDFECGGSRVVKGASLRRWWRRPTRVRIPSPALFFKGVFLEKNSSKLEEHKIEALESQELSKRKSLLDDLKKEGIIAELVGNRIIIWDHDKGFKVFAAGFFGKPIGIPKPRIEPFKRPLEISFFEALYLMEKKVLKVKDVQGTDLSQNKLIELANSYIHDFESKYQVYRDLREKGFVVRPGLKFGSDFAVYRYGPGIDHAPFLVTVYPSDTKLLGIDLVRAGRLATSVRKKWVIATITHERGIKYFVFSWFKA